MSPGPRFHTLRHPLYLAGAAAAVAISVISYFQWDRAAAEFFFHLTDPRIEPWAERISLLGTIVRPELAFLIWLVFRRRNPRWATAALFFVAAIIGAGLVNTPLKFILGRSRPELFFADGIFGFHGFEPDAEYWSMPSGHTATTMAAMMTITLLFPRIGWVLLIQAGLVALSRVALMDHFISDVLIGGVVGAGVALAIYDLYFRKALERVNWWRSGRRGNLSAEAGQDRVPEDSPG